MEPPTAKVSESQLSLHTFDQLQIPCISQGTDLSGCHGSQVHSLRGWLILTLSCELQDKAWFIPSFLKVSQVTGKTKEQSYLQGFQAFVFIWY